MLGVWCRVFFCLALVMFLFEDWVNLPTHFLALLLSRPALGLFFFFLFWNTGLVLYYIVRLAGALEC